MTNKIPFKLEVNDKLITEYEITNGTFLFNIEQELFSLKKLCKLSQLTVICDSCGNKRVVKNIQQRIKLDNVYLCPSCRNTGEKNGMFNKRHSDETIKTLREKHSGTNNHFYGKKHTNESILKQKVAKVGLYVGEKNPMYGRTFFDVWVDKYGVDIALDMLAKKSKKHSDKISGNTNPMYGKSLVDIWIDKYGVDVANNMYLSWRNNIKNSLIDLYHDNNTLKDKISTSLTGRVFTDEHKLNLRLSSIEYIKRKIELNGGKMMPHFNIYACQLLDEISKIMGINIQHALNGGEYYISELGYWVDGYDQKNNVVYEYYEREHKKRIDKDSLREQAIKNHLKCEFRIIHENKEIEFLNNLI